MLNERLLLQRFEIWLEKYNHHLHFASIGEALMGWMLSSDACKQLDLDYGRFLNFGSLLLSSGKGSLRTRRLEIMRCGRETTYEIYYYSIALPSDTEGNLPTLEDFELASRMRAESDNALAALKIIKAQVQ